MAQSQRHPAEPFNRRRANGGPLPVLLAAVGFAAVLGALFWLNGRPAAENTGPVVPQQASAPAAPEPESAPPTAADLPEVANTPVPPSPAVEAVAAVEPAAVAEPEPVPAMTVAEQVAAHLTAGEFGQAMALAETADDAEKGRLLRQILDAQLEAGEFRAALASIRQLPEEAERLEARRERNARQSLTGGQADPTQLMQLVMMNTIPEAQWFDIDGEGGTMTFFNQGVLVDPNGMLQNVTQKDKTGRLEALGRAARIADLNEDMARASDMRLVSLTRLERAVSDRLREGRPVVETMRNMAGLTAIRYVFIFPEEGEIVVAGPAEGWRYDDQQNPVGASNGRPTLQLDDLVVLLRTFSPEGKQMFRCSINPRQEGLKALKEYVAKSNARGPLPPNYVSTWTRQLQDKLGLQDIEIEGVPAESRVARVIVEADYRMKLIGIDKLDGGPGIPSFFELLPLNLQKNPPTLDALRWWLTMKYDAVNHSLERTTFEVRGSSVLCQSENQLISSLGQQVPTGKAEDTNRLFAENFTRHYHELAQRDPVFADLQNVFDLALVAALIRQEGLDVRAGWDRGSFATNGLYQPAAFNPPTTVMSVVNHKVYNGRDIVVQVAGGVQADLMAVVRDPELGKETPQLEAVAQQARSLNVPDGRWWWDAGR